MKILVVNAGSSSLKFQLITSDTGAVLAKGLVERIGLNDGIFNYSRPSHKKVVEIQDIPNHSFAIDKVVKTLVDAELGVISSLDEIQAVGHRVVHGGEKFADSALITPEVKEAIKECFSLAPLHNPANITGIEACEQAIPNVPQVAVFDTAFHQTMPARAYMYAIPYKFYKENAVRRYGFHGTSHDYVSKRAAEILGTTRDKLKIVTCHLGNGSSLAAVDQGKSIDTSMGMTPLAGPMMGTRSGDIDPAIIRYLVDSDASLDLNSVDTLLNKKSGVLGVSGISSDFRDIIAASKEGNERATVALEMFTYSVRKYIAAYAAAMTGIDALVFTAGVGENSFILRNMICKGLEFMGIEIDKAYNDTIEGEEAIISTKDSKVKILVVPTNEELKIAIDTERIVSAK